MDICFRCGVPLKNKNVTIDGFYFCSNDCERSYFIQPKINKKEDKLSHLVSEFYESDGEVDLDSIRELAHKIFKGSQNSAVAHSSLAVCWLYKSEEANKQELKNALEEIDKALALDDEKKFYWSIKKNIAKYLKDKKMMEFCDKKIKEIQKESTIHSCPNCKSKFFLTKKQMKEVEDYLPGEVSCPECFNKFEIK